MTVLGIVGIIFITLKLIGLIDWSWWWVLSPFIINIILFLGFVGAVSASVYSRFCN